MTPTQPEIAATTQRKPAARRYFDEVEIHNEGQLRDLFRYLSLMPQPFEIRIEHPKKERR